MTEIRRTVAAICTAERASPSAAVPSCTRVLVAHGTRTKAGATMILDLATAVSARIGAVRTAFVDVLGPDPTEVLSSVAGPAVVVPAFLASGYHVRTDLPAHVLASGHREVVVTAALGPNHRLALAMRQRLIEVGWRHGDAVVMAAAGSSDPGARRDLAVAAALLGDLVGTVDLAFIATGLPTVADVVARRRSAGAQRVFIAPYLLSHGLFHDRLYSCGADAVGAPLGVHAHVVELLVARFTVGSQEHDRRRTPAPPHR